MSTVDLYKGLDDLKSALAGIATLADGKLSVNDEGKFRDLAYPLVYNSIFNSDAEVQELCRWLIRAGANALGCPSASIHDLYMARGRNEWSGFTVPAINIRGITFDVADMIFKAAMKDKVGPVIFEIARSEIGYTEQRPAEYATAVLGAAIANGYKGPVYIQGDHFQVNAKKYAASPEGELGTIRDLITEAIDAGFYNIDIDSSTLVDLSKSTEEVQQEANAAVTHELTTFIREREPEGVTISIGGEIGEVGTENSTVEDLQGFMSNYSKKLSGSSGDMPGISKLSVQTGTAHGGVPLPDGSIAEANVDFDTLAKLSKVSQEEYGIGGAVQHGASTLPPEAFHFFPEKETVEIHLATGFQNIIYDHDSFPADMRKAVYDHLSKAHADERKEGQTDEQFIYKTRKKGFGPFKKQMWDLPADVKGPICDALKKQFSFLFEQLGMPNTEDLMNKIVKPKAVDVAPPASASKVLG
jgi:hypothetical protein